ncbi:MAG: cupin domain-containing protein [Pricia sp.]|nr:cupin domain-containing protein [Pricia sp.]
MNQIAEPYLYLPGESELRWTGKTSTYFLATGALTGGNFSLVEERAILNESVPLHRHDDIESFYILEGEVLFYIGDNSRLLAVAGAFMHIPGGTVHGFRIASDIARYLILTTPRHGEFYSAISLPSFQATIDDSVIEEACQRYGVEFVGPLPA